MGTLNWRGVPQDRDGWRSVNREGLLFLTLEPHKEEKKKN
jgi:hypothetical protein